MVEEGASLSAFASLVASCSLQLGHVIMHGDHDLLDAAYPLHHGFAVFVEC